MWRDRLLRACLVTSAFLAVAVASPRAQAQANFDRPGGDYQSSLVSSGDPAECALVCERDRRCRAWTFAYPTDVAGGAVCWLKNSVPARTQDNCCVSGVRGAGVVEPRTGPVEYSIDRVGGDLRIFDIATDAAGAACKAACETENKCRAWTYVRPGYIGASARCYLKDRITPPRAKPCCISGVVR